VAHSKKEREDECMCMYASEKRKSFLSFVVSMTKQE